MCLHGNTHETDMLMLIVAMTLSTNNKGFHWKGIKEIDKEESGLVLVTSLEIFCPYLTKPGLRAAKGETHNANICFKQNKIK